ncbi:MULTISPECIES: hypothetical protein [unclassified Herbaspirillum]|uniref:hypothetical protein n=1 Tax=unclassified Herbaspirillum TaxID=2624150 RepID=UPI0011D246DF|nr:hypothetical protein [Herbaspirillum sp. B65]BEV16840.1 hypothetical protein HBDW_36280 [Herbaspirillum sp. DW155]
MRIFIALFLFLTAHCSLSFAAAVPVTRMQNSMSGVVQAKMQSRGFASNDPRWVSTLSNVSSSIAGGLASAATVTLLGVTAPAWVTVAAPIVAGVAVALTVDAAIKWIFKPDGTVQVGDNPASVNTPAGLKPPSVVYIFSNAVAGSPQAACSGAVYTDFTAPGGHGTQHAELKSDGNCHLIRVYTYDSGASETIDMGSLNAPTKSSNNTTLCPGVKLTASAGVCPASNFPEPPQAPVKTVSDAAAGLSDAQKAQPLNPQVIADLANDFWKAAASSPGYNGLPFDATNPITAADAAAWQSANPSSWPTVGDFVAPQAAPSGGTAATPFTLPTASSPVATADPSATPSTGTNPSNQPLENLGPDPGIGAPSLEPTPTAQQILQPILNLFPTLTNFVVPGHSAACPTWTIQVFNKDIAMTQHCVLLEKIRPTLYAAMALVWVLVALFIVLAA